MAKSEIKAVFWDFDGTLGATEADIRRGWRETLAELKLECPDYDKIFRVGPSLPEMAKMLFPAMSEAESAKLQQCYRRNYDESDFDLTEAYPWCIEILETFAQMGKKQYIVTNKRWLPTWRLTEKLGFTEYISGFFTPDILPELPMNKGKMLELAVRVAGITPNKALMIGDTEVDINAGIYAGTHTCAVTWGYGDVSKISALAEISMNSATWLDDFKAHYC